MDKTGLPKDVWMNFVKASSVSLLNIADPATEFGHSGNFTCQRDSVEGFLLSMTVLPSLETCTLYLVKVAMHPLLQSSDILRRDVPSSSSGKMWAWRGEFRCGRNRLPVLDDVIV